MTTTTSLGTSANSNCNNQVYQKVITNFGLCYMGQAGYTMVCMNIFINSNLIENLTIIDSIFYKSIKISHYYYFSSLH